VFQKCPKCGYARKPGEIEAPERCPACGLIFAAYVWGAALLYFQFRNRGSDAIDDDS
jgi:hypothetical protein